MSEVNHTSLPWIAAAAVSSVVGLPVVAQDGRPICNVQSVPKGFPNEEHHNAVAVANGAFIERACNSHYDLLAALEASQNLLAGNSTVGGPAEAVHNAQFLHNAAVIARARGIA
jgi:hypothetical protein